MKKPTLPIISALLVFLFTGCSNNSSPDVISAVYGEGTNFTDVSVQVKGLLGSGVRFDVNPNYLKADPLIGYNKVLVIVYSVNGQRHLFTAPENTTVTAGNLLAAARQ